MALFKNKKQYELKNELIDKNNIPHHIAIIMDGNGRWAKKRGLPRTAGHAVGADTLVKIAKYAFDIGVKVLSVYAFSTENWSRPESEVSNLMNLSMEKIPQMEALMEGREVCVKFLGDVDKFNPKLYDMLKKEEERTKKYENTGKYLNICANYGSRDEITLAVKKISEKVKTGEIDIADITPELISQNLYTAHCPDPDLIIRPSGEYRLSNFLMYQAAYSEFYYDNILWPDFKPEDLDNAIIAYQKRDRRYGGVKEEAEEKGNK